MQVPEPIGGRRAFTVGKHSYTWVEVRAKALEQHQVELRDYLVSQQLAL